MSSDFELPRKQANSPSKRKDNPASSAQISAKEIPGQEDAEVSQKSDLESKEPKYNEEELLRIFDEIIFSDEYVESISLRGRVPVAFRTRTAEEVNQIQKIIDTSGFNLISSVESLRSILNLQYSLIQYKDKDLKLMKIEERAKFIEKLPGPVVGMLITEMSKFDHKIAAACKMGEQNF